MAETKYQQQFARDVKEVSREVDGKAVKMVRFRGIIKYRDVNPSFVEAPKDGSKDTRTATQKRRYVWKQVGKNLECKKGRSKAQTERNISDTLTAWREEMEAAANEPERNEGVTVTEYIEQFIATREAAGAIEASTARDYRHSAKRLEAAFSSVPLLTLDAGKVQAWEIAELKRGISATVVGKVHRLLVAVCRWAVRHGDIERNPMDMVEPPKRPKTTPNSLEQKDMQRLTAALLEREPTPLVVSAFLALHAGLRAGECCGLTWRDVDLENKQLRVERAIGIGDGGAYVKTPKSNSGRREVPFDDELAAMLHSRRELMKRERAQLDLVEAGSDFDSLYVTGTPDGRYLNPTILSKYWHVMADDYGLKGTQGRRPTFHDLRHSFVTAAVHAGMDVVNVAANAGHASTQMTLDVYSSSTREGKRRTADAVGDFMRPAGKPAGETIEHDFSKTGTDN